MWVATMNLVDGNLNRIACCKWYGWTLSLGVWADNKNFAWKVEKESTAHRNVRFAAGVEHILIRMQSAGCHDSRGANMMHLEQQQQQQMTAENGVVTKVSQHQSGWEQRWCGHWKRIITASWTSDTTATWSQRHTFRMRIPSTGFQARTTVCSLSAYSPESRDAHPLLAPLFSNCVLKCFQYPRHPRQVKEGTATSTQALAPPSDTALFWCLFKHTEGPTKQQLELEAKSRPSSRRQ